MKKICFLFVSCLFQLLSYSQADIAINPNITFNGENSLAVNPANNNNLIVAWMKFTFPAISIVASKTNDGGLTWSTPVILPHTVASHTSADPTLVFGNNGTAYLVYIDFKTTRDSGEVVITKSTDGGTTWSNPVKIIDVFASADIPIDRPWLAIDNSGSVYNGWLYVVTKSVNEAPSPHHIWLMSSADDGVTWTAPKLIDNDIPIGNNLNFMGVPAVSANGNLHIQYYSYVPALNLFPRSIDAKSADGGTTLTYQPMFSFPLASASNPNDTLYQGSYHIAANPVNANNLITVFTDYRAGDIDIFYSISNDGGTTWSNAARLNDDAAGNGKGQDMCWAGFSKTGKYAALWRDRRNGIAEQTGNYQVYGAYSANDGNSFINFQLQQTLAPLFTPVDGNDFLGVAVNDNYVFGTWADNRTGKNQIYFNYFQIPLATGVNDIIKEEGFRLIVQSNPVSNLVAYQLKVERKITIITELFDIAGRKIISKVPQQLLPGNYQKEISLTGLSSGIYFLKVNGLIKKFLKR